MMILLSQREYNDLIKRAGQIEPLVEERVQEEKKKIRELLQRAFHSDIRTSHLHTGESLLQYIRDNLNRILD